ncbi:MAG: Mu transposase C-terminal domain-containing protein [Desulfovibrio sp.]|jgi:putative transposase|nr:Mu transposase C-terminal domain-containing protein [Desulfovibrio sp.]
MKTGDALTTQELSNLFGAHISSILRRAEREGWKSRPRGGRGGGKEWILSSMPQTTKAALATALFRQPREHLPALPDSALPAVSVPAVPPAALAAPAPPAAVDAVHDHSDLSACTKREREIAEARLALLREISPMVEIVGKVKALNQIVEGAKNGTLAPKVRKLLMKANARPREVQSSIPSSRTLFRWFAYYEKGGTNGLAPAERRPDLSMPAWGEAFLRHYQRPQKPSVDLAYRDFCVELRIKGAENVPKIGVVRHWLKKWSPVDLERGRRTGNALLKLLPYRIRSTKDLSPGDVYTADGTTFDAEIRHPYHGNPFKPEITCIIDVATRKCVGISANLAENAYTVLDALRIACVNTGIPAMFYTDNGPGYRNDMLESPATGILARLGITEAHSIPGRPQGKGLMERAIQTINTAASKRLPTSTHKDMDTDAQKKVFKITRAQIKEYQKERRINLMPTWEDFKQVILFTVEEYNNSPHRSLPKIFDEDKGKHRHMSPNELWQRFAQSGEWEPRLVPETMRTDLFMPSEMRMVKNAMIQFYGHSYYARELTDFHRARVEVRYDVWDSSKIYVYVPHGPRICIAEIDGNVIPYFPPCKIEEARAKRDKKALERLEAKAQRIAPSARLELPQEGPAILTVADSVTIPDFISNARRVDDTVPEIPSRPKFGDYYQKYDWLMRNPAHQGENDKIWLKDYAQSQQYAEFRELYEVQGIAYKPDAADADIKGDEQ